MKFPPRKKVNPFGMKAPPFRVTEGRYVPLGPDLLGVFEVVEEHANYLVCEDWRGNELLVAKAHRLRADTFDGETINDVTYTSTGAGTRTASRSSEEEVEEAITPAYAEGDQIVAMKRELVVDETKYLWEDLGIGRRWEVDPPYVKLRAKFVSEADNTIQATILRPDGTDGQTVTVAKQHHLRRSTYDGQTIDGVTYTYADANTRSATDGEDTETQTITPAYSATEQLTIERLANGTGVASADWIEATSRQWAAEPEE